MAYQHLAHDSAAIRFSCATALADAAEHYSVQVEPTIQQLQALYVDKAKILEPEYDRFVSMARNPEHSAELVQGMVIVATLNRPDPFESRVAIASGLDKMAPLITQSMVVPIFEFLIDQEALGDRHSEVRRTMLNAAIAIIDLHGGEAVTNLMKMFEDYLAKSHPDTDTADYIKEAVVIVSRASGG